MINLTNLFYNFRIKIKPFYELARYDKPIGFKLLMWPCLWSYLAATFFSNKSLEIEYIIFFIIGSIIMRGAGCTWNFQLVAGFLILIQFNSLTIFIGILSIIPIVIYPLMKRITWWPQIFLGLTFNWGAIIGWTAVTDSFSIYCITLYLGCIFWTVGYDTIYAHQDKIDDEFLGLKSSAIFLGKKSKPAISIFYSIFFISISFLLISLDPMNRWLSFSLLAIIGFHLIRQIYLLDIDNPEICNSIFKSNNSIGLLVFFLFFFLF